MVFLAVKGELAIFTSGESNPNSYVLLLTCLIAAVFSEDVWQAAHKEFQKRLRAEPEPAARVTTTVETQVTAPAPGADTPAADETASRGLPGCF